MHRAKAAASLKQRVRAARSKFIAMAASYAMGTFNDNFFRQGILLLAVDIGRAGYQQYISLLFTVPYLLVAAPAGWLADRFSKHRVVVGAKTLEMLAMVLGAVGVCTGSWPLMFAMVAIMGLQSCLFSPSLNGSIPELYPPEYVTDANARLKAVVTASILSGIALAGVVLDLPGDSPFGIPWARMGVAVTVLAVAAIGLGASFGVPRRRAADPDAKFPWTGPLVTVRDLLSIRTDQMLTIAVLVNTFIWATGMAELLMINVLGVRQYGWAKSVTSLLCLSQLVGLAMGQLLSALFTRGRRWYRMLAPGLLGIGLTLCAVSLTPLFPAMLQAPLLFLWLWLAGVLGGLIMVPCEAFIQVHPPAKRKGRIIAAANFAVFCGLALAGPLQDRLIAWMGCATGAFAPLGLMAVGAGLLLAWELPPGPGNPIDAFLVGLARLLFRLRYRIRVVGLREITEKGTDGILFLPNHPALIDPPMLVTLLFPRFHPRTWADQDQVDRFFIRWIAPRLGAVPVPSVASARAESRSNIETALDRCVEALSNGECFLLYPSGHVYRSYLEDLRGKMAAHRIVDRLPDVRVVLMRTTGLWGSSFSWASGQAPVVGSALRNGALGLLLSGIFFAPKREVTIEFFEPDDLPREADRDEFNSYLEEFYNAEAPPNTYVPYSIWERGGARKLPEPFIGVRAGDTSAVPEGTRQMVVEHLEEEAGLSSISEADHLARDLGLDSLARSELIAWLEAEFGFTVNNPDSLQTVADVLLAACGEAVAGEPAELKPVPKSWFRRQTSQEAATAPEGDTVTELFLRAARRKPGRVAFADQRSGAKTYRDVVTGVMALRPDVEALGGQTVGIMLPASVTAAVAYFAVLFAGKTPVMVNWTVGPRNVEHSLDSAEVEAVLTARALVDRLKGQGNDLSPVADRFVYLEDVAAGMTLWRKARAWIGSRLSWKSLSESPQSDTAVILFTSGSESVPKGVPLSHANILANMRDIARLGIIRRHDALLGILPPFHSFGLTVTVVLAACFGIPVVYSPDPTEGGLLARLIEAYKVTLLCGTPTFVYGIVRASTPEQLSSLRLVVTGAEKCSDRIYEAIVDHCPQTTVLEGYGITECSPIVALNDYESPRRGSIGRPLPSVEHKIVDPETNEPVETGERGMLLVRGPSIFSGYLAHSGPDPFVEVEGKQWYRTGDLVSQDEDGVLTFRGRLKRFTKIGGEMISLPAIEEVLAEEFGTQEDEGPSVAVEATRDTEHPELVLFTTRDIDREAANDLIRQAGLSSLHNIRRVVHMEALPVLGTGKTDYRALRETLSDED